MSKPAFVAGGLVAAQVVAIAVMRATSRTAEGDLFDAPIHWWSWVLWPAVGFIAARRFPSAPPVVWSAAVTVPMLVAVVWAGTIGHDPDDGASFWLVGAGFVLARGALVLGAATLGATRSRGRHADEATQPRSTQIRRRDDRAPPPRRVVVRARVAVPRGRSAR